MLIRPIHSWTDRTPFPDSYPWSSRFRHLNSFTFLRPKRVHAAIVHTSGTTQVRFEGSKAERMVQRVYECDHHRAKQNVVRSVPNPVYN